MGPAASSENTGELVGTGERGLLGSVASTTTARKLGAIGGGSGGANGGSASCTGNGADSTELLEVIFVNYVVNYDVKVSSSTKVYSSVNYGSLQSCTPL